MARFLALAFAIYSSFFCSLAVCEYSEEEIQSAINKMDMMVEQGLKDLNIPGCAVVVVHRDKILFKKAFGKTTLPDNNPQDISEETLFPISSMTKSLTASLVAALVDAGRIKFEDKVRKYDPDFFLHSEEYSKELTIKDLISHASGYSHGAADSLFAAGYDKETVLKAFKYLNPIPGHFRKYYGYQNVIFGMIGDVLEKAIGEKYEDLIKKYIFDPCEMNLASALPLRFETSRWGHMKYLYQRFPYDSKRHGFFSTLWNFIKSSITFSPKKIAKSHSKYKFQTLCQPYNDILSTFPATSGISLSINDGAKWLTMMVNHGMYKGKRLITSETFDKLTTPVVKAIDIKEHDFVFPIARFSRDDIQYCIGTFVSNYSDTNGRKEPIVYHMGGMFGSSSYYAISQKNQLGICVFVNLGGVTHTRFALGIVFSFLDALFGYSKIDWVKEELKQMEYYKDREKLSDDINSSPIIPMAKKEKYIGTYHNDMYGDVNIKLNSEGELIMSNGIRSAVLKHFNGHMFKFSAKDMFVSFIDRDGTVSFSQNKFGQFESISVSYLQENEAKFLKK